MKKNTNKNVQIEQTSKQSENTSPTAEAFANPRIPGIEFDFGGGRVYTIAPLTLGDLQRLQAKIGKLYDGSALEPATGETVVQITLAALRRNYPDIALETVSELVDLGNMYDVVSCVLDVASTHRKAYANENKKSDRSAFPFGPVDIVTSA